MNEERTWLTGTGIDNARRKLEGKPVFCTGTKFHVHSTEHEMQKVCTLDTQYNNIDTEVTFRTGVLQRVDRNLYQCHDCGKVEVIEETRHKWKTTP
jgi:hypothetical protein